MVAGRGAPERRERRRERLPGRTETPTHRLRTPPRLPRRRHPAAGATESSLFGGPRIARRQIREIGRPEAVLARCMDGGSIAALCYDLPVAPQAEERNPDYAARLQQVLRDLEFPAEYVDSVTSR